MIMSFAITISQSSFYKACEAMLHEPFMCKWQQWCQAKGTNHFHSPTCLKLYKKDNVNKSNEECQVVCSQSDDRSRWLLFCLLYYSQITPKLNDPKIVLWLTILPRSVLTTKLPLKIPCFTLCNLFWQRKSPRSAYHQITKMGSIRKMRGDDFLIFTFYTLLVQCVSMLHALKCFGFIHVQLLWAFMYKPMSRKVGIFSKMH